MLGGFGRSGSTLLERCLAECPDVTGLGEVLHLWERGLRDDERCGCSEKFSRCDFWCGIGTAAFGQWEAVDAAAAIAERRAVVRNRYLPQLITGFSSGSYRQQQRRFLARLDALYAAVQGTTGASLIVDSSKHPAYAYLLRKAAIDLKCVLVVRDPRGVAYSWSKVVHRPEAGNAEFMPRYSTVASVLRWGAYGILFHGLTLLGVPVKTVHYEDFMADPVGVVRDILEFAGLSPGEEATAHLSAADVTLSAHHTVAGNPMRFRTGTLTVRRDTEWKQKMPAGQRAVASVLSAPLRLAYGMRRRSSDAAPARV
ncbi:sulfotransferase [Arthrobacter sp. CAN_A6]|uniref:sulfotransferase n=1 Tax=Arthrobacter sp. CAN_A6 TaxID=2787721 RepID=UPI002FF1D32F